MNVKHLIIAAALLTAAPFTAQDTLRISKSDLSQKVFENNLQLRIASQEIELSRADYRQSNALFLPNITASHTAVSTTNPLMAFGSKLNQEILTQADFNPVLLNDPDRTENFATKVEVLQPIINMDGLFERQVAKAKVEAYSLQAERTKEYLQLEIDKAYMQLQLAYKAVEVLKKAEKTALANGKLIDNYNRQGLLQKTDVLAMQVRINEVRNQLQYALSNLQNVSDYLKFLMNDKENTSVLKPNEELTESTSLTTLSGNVPDNRKDLQAMDYTVKAHQKMLKAEKFSLFPRLNAFGTYELYDDEIFGTAARGYTIGAQLSWNLFDGYQSFGKIQKAKVAVEKAQTEQSQYLAQSQLELHKSYRQLQDAQNKLELAKLNLQQSEEAYRIKQNRFEQGLEKTTDLLQSEAQLLQKELEYLQAVFEYNFTQQYISFLQQ